MFQANETFKVVQRGCLELVNSEREKRDRSDKCSCLRRLCRRERGQVK